MKQYLGNKILAVSLGFVAALFILITLLLLIRHNVAEAPMSEVSGEQKTTVVKNGIQAQSSTTLPAIESVVEKTVVLQNGVTQEIRNEVPLKEWRHVNGIVVTLYEKDYFYEKASREAARQVIIRAKKPTGEMVEVLEDVPAESPRFGTSVINMIEFSPLGNYIVIDEVLYESSRTRVFDLKNGTEVFGNDSVYSLEYAWPSWNGDESKLLLISSAEPIGGCEHCPGIWYSKTGSFTEVQSVVDLTADEYIEQPFFGGMERKNEVLEIEVTYPDPNNNNQYTTKKNGATFSFETGKLSSEVPYLNN